MKNERELFEEEFKKINSNIVFWLNTWDEDMQGYNHPTMCWIWHIWQASASREDYKLVPLEPNEAMLEALQVGFKPDYEGGSYDSYEGYKAVIGVVE